MSNTVVVYKSKYGSTKKYAEWISEEIKADLFESSKINLEKLKSYDKIIYGGGLYANGISGISIITKNYEALKNKKIVVFTVGIATTEDKETLTSIIESSFSKEMIEGIKFFHFRGSIDYKDLGMIHKSMMSMLKTKLSSKGAKKLNDDEIDILVTKKGKLDYIDKKSIDPLVSYIKE